MKKNLFLFMLLTIISLKAVCQEPKYSQWLYLQSDKALQYRIAVVKQEGTVASLKLQFRVNNEDEVYCKSALCEGMLLSLKNVNAGDEISTKYSFIFEKSFAGINNVYTWPQLITTELKTWPDGSKRFFNPAQGIVYTNSGDDTEHFANVPDACVDIRLASNPNEHRCERHGFNMRNAIIVK